jgi:large subunit ribosomal protein L3
MHRGMGSAGGSQGSGSRVLPGKRMAGRMGNESVTVKNLKVLQVDEENGIVVVNGTCMPFIASSLAGRRRRRFHRLKY